MQNPHHSSAAPTATPLAREVAQFYSSLARILPIREVRFLNHGFKDERGEPVLAWRDPADARQKFSFMLLDKLLGGADLAGSRVLDVGCGRGGGAYFLREYRQAGSVLGIDANPDHIALCRRHYPDPAYDFAVVDAMDVRKVGTGFDALLCLESVSVYADPIRFLGEAMHVLRPGGVAFVADACAAEAMPVLPAVLERLGYVDVAFEDITQGVIAAMEADWDERRRLLEAHVAPDAAAGIFARVQELPYRDYVSGRLRYAAFRARRPAET